MRLGETEFLVVGHWVSAVGSGGDDLSAGNALCGSSDDMVLALSGPELVGDLSLRITKRCGSFLARLINWATRLQRARLHVTI